MADKPTGAAAVALVDEFVGRRVRRVSRLYYSYRGELDASEGELQIEFTDGSVLLLKGDSTGELLCAASTAWRDPFSGELSDENREYISKHGRPVMTDVSSEAEYNSIIGRKLDRVYPLSNRFGSVIGAQMHFGDRKLNFYVSADECEVAWGDEGMPLWSDTP